MEIEVEEYVRTKKGLIGKVNKIESAGSGVRFGGEFLTDTIIQFNDGKVYERRVRDKDIVKHSKNIIDLIDVGDYVNGEKVLNIRRVAEDIEPFKTEISKKEIAICIFKTGDEEYYKTRKEKDIKTILTKEQMEANQYVVK